MYDVKSMINEITSKKEINNISFTGCGGSLACFFAPHYYVTHESKKLTTVYENANEFANDTPANVGENSLVVCASRRGDTRQTVAAVLLPVTNAISIGYSGSCFLCDSSNNHS